MRTRIFALILNKLSYSYKLQNTLGKWLQAQFGFANQLVLKATLDARLRSRDHYTSRTLIGGKGGVGPSSLHTTLEGPTEYVNARWM